VPETRAVAVAFGADIHEATAEFGASGRRCRLVLRLDDGRVLTADAHDYFECLMTIRKAIEPAGGLVLCQGARRDVWPSGMARDMGAGLKAYILVKGRPPRSDELVNTFDPTDESLVGTLAEQRAAYRAWIVSRGLAPPPGG
jgi:hypothetical protein